MKNNTVYVGNIPFDTTETELRGIFSAQIIRVTIVADRETGKAKGFAFVEFGNSEDAAKEVEILDGIQLGGRTLKVSIARERQRDGGGGGRQGDRRDRRDNRRSHHDEDEREYGRFWK